MALLVVTTTRARVAYMHMCSYTLVIVFMFAPLLLVAGSVEFISNYVQ